MNETPFAGPIGPVPSEWHMTKNPPEYHSHFSVPVTLPPGIGPNGLASAVMFHVPMLYASLFTSGPGFGRPCGGCAWSGIARNIVQTLGSTVILFTIGSVWIGPAGG